MQEKHQSLNLQTPTTNQSTQLNLKCFPKLSLPWSWSLWFSLIWRLLKETRVATFSLSVWFLPFINFRLKIVI